MKLLILWLPALFLTVSGCLRIRWPEKCSPTDKSVFLFAYSNDLEFTEIYEVYSWFQEPIGMGQLSKIAIAATARFDSKTKEDIVFHDGETMSDSSSAALDYMDEQQVDPSRRFDSSETGSDVLDMLERFIDTNHKNLCGSVAFIVMKRSPNEVETSKLVRKIREYHILLTIAVMHPPSGGLHPETMYNLAAQTNGQCAFGNVVRDTFYSMVNIFHPYTYYTYSLKVSGTGTINLPPLTLQKSVLLILGVGAQSTANADSFKNLTLSWVNTQIGATGSFARTREQMNVGSYNSFCEFDFLEAEPTIYELKLEYSYSMGDIIVIRMNSMQAIDHWLPYQG
ncbi:unnamed protein product [Caenorhabditis nigoni]